MSNPFQLRPVGGDVSELEMVKSYARMVRNDLHLRRILQDSHPALRRHVYDLIKPHLSFVPRDFKKLMKHAY